MKRLVGSMTLATLAAWQPAVVHAQTTSYTVPFGLDATATVSGQASFTISSLPPSSPAAGFYQNYANGTALALTLSNASVAVNLNGVGQQPSIPATLQAILQSTSNSSAGSQPGRISTNITDSTIGLTFEPSTMPTGNHAMTGVYMQADGASGASSSPGIDAGGIDFNLSNSTITVNTTVAGQGAAVGVLSQGGLGGTGQEKAAGGHGGAAGSITGTVSDVTLYSSGQGVGGLVVNQIGGAGGNGQANEEFSSGGTGANAAGMYVLFGSSGRGSSIMTDGANAPGIAMLARGGNGGIGSDHDGELSIDETGSHGGTGGSVLSITDPTGASNSISFRSCSPNLSCAGPLAITTSGQNAYGMQLLATGGNGGNSGAISAGSDLSPGIPGIGGNTGSVSLELFPNATIKTTGDGASAILAQSQGGAGGTSGPVHVDTGNATTAPGGQGGTGGNVWIYLHDQVSLSTSGASADGVTARSVGGLGGSVGEASGGIGVANGGNGGKGGASSGIDITSAATIRTTGSTSRGILAQAISGMGGNGGDSGAVFSSQSGGPGVSGTVGAIQITNSGAITTKGSYSQGILAQSISGGGGAGGSATGSLFYDQGGGGAENSNAGTISLTSSGSITTSGEAAMAIVGQSVGGGGGMGGTAGGVFYASGGQGGMGGAGGNVSFSLSGPLQTQGLLAHGAVAQSIGGGGGAGGNSYSNSAAVAYSVGGAGGSGGPGGAVTVNATDLSTTAYGAGAIGIIAQSVGGGGGSGGAGYATSVGASFSAAASLGGSGGSGGAGGAASVTLTNSKVKTDGGIDAHGVVVQSIGGGGGVGGGASANAVAVSMPMPAESGQATSFTITAAYAVGGSGGNGGGAANATLGLNGSTISTSGNGGHGAIVQSIGGGGGNGGDSSAMTASFGYGFTQFLPDYTISSQSVAATLAVGGSCASGSSSCVGGNGASASISLGQGNGLPAPSVTTTGDFAAGVVVQSVGGGGGNAGIGNANTNSYGIDSTYSLTMTIGAQGGAGGNGGNVSATTGSTSSIATSGASAPGLVVQSIGGGGGIGSGGSGSIEGLFNWAQSVIGDGESEHSSLNLNPNVTVGAKNGSAGSGGSVSVSSYGAITTRGNDSPALIAQSIGGGGGIGGSAATPASGALPESATVGSTSLPSVGVNLGLNVGGVSAQGGSAGAVSIGHGGSAATSGDYSHGLLAQSIGGGGGRGAVAYLNNQSQNVMAGLVSAGMRAGVQVGGQGQGYAGNEPLGGAVTVRLDGSSISTAGLQSYGILAQSISGGGGTGVDASFDPNGEYVLGGDDLSTVRAGSNGSLVKIETSGVPTIITTAGRAGHGVVAQSIGAGGGVMGIGSSANGGQHSGTPVIYLGGASSFGAGGPLYIAPQNVTTSGDGAFGILAQSIGGGGGLVETTSGGAITLARIGTIAGGGDGGSVAVFTSDISTRGVGSHGVVAQSIGGGGGVFSNYAAGQGPALSQKMPVPGSLDSYGNGGPVSVSTSTDVVVTGAGAFGVLAQSIGGGGGFAALNGVAYAGSTSGSNTSYVGGTVTVVAQGSVTASGENGIGIFAQSDGPGGGGDISVTLGANTPGVVPGGFVSGGSGEQGAGIVLAGGRNNLITVGQGSWVWAASGTAIRQVGPHSVNVANYGTVYGDTWLNGGGYTSGTQVPGSPTSAATLTNFAVIAPMPGQRSIIDGHLVQATSGRIAPHLDYSNLRSGSYLVTGNADLAGSIQPTLATAMPHIFLPVLEVEGARTGTLSAPDSPLFSYTLRETAQRYDIAITGAHFNAPQFGLTPLQAGLANALQGMFFQGRPQLGAFYAGLNTVAGEGAASYRSALGALAPRSAMTLFSRASANATSIADASMSCPKFGGAGVGIGAHAFLSEGECAYVMTRGQRTIFSGDLDRGRANLDSAAWQVGGQRQVGAGLLLGGSLAYQTDWFSGRDGVSAQGSSVQGTVTLKYQTGPWLLTGAVFGSFGDYDIKRRVVAPTVAAIAGADVSSHAIGLRARAAYTFGGESFYVRPYLNLDLVHARNGSFGESGVGDLGLKVDGGAYDTAILTPAIELGSRLDLANGMALRSFVSAGVSLRSNDTWKGYAGFNGDLQHQRFAMSAPWGRATARVSAGLQLFQSEFVDVRLQYDGEYGSEAIRHGATASLAYRF